VNLADYAALSFDCYGTLIDWESGIGAVLTAWSRDNDLDLDQEALLTYYAEHEARTEAQLPHALYPDILARSFASLGRQLGVTVAAQWAAALGRSVPDWPAFPDSPDALTRLARHYRLIIVSNVDRACFAASNSRLGVSFDRIITAEDVGSYKPAAGHFDALREALDALGVGTGKHLHVAQSLFHDHVPAKEAGLPTVWINRRHDRPGWGATPQPPAPVRPDWEFPSMRAFAAAAQTGFRS